MPWAVFVKMAVTGQPTIWKDRALQSLLFFVVVHSFSQACETNNNTTCTTFARQESTSLPHH